MDVLNQSFLGNLLFQWGIALGIVLVWLVIFLLVRAIAVHRLAKIAARTNTIIDDIALLILQHTKAWLVVLVASYFGSLALTLPASITLWIQTIAVIAFITQGAFWIDAVLMFWMQCYQTKTMETNASQATTVRTLGYVFRVALLSLLFLMALDNIPGVEVTALVASLGVAGIAVALALQSVLSDLFASLSIALDKPFVINDFIIVGDFMGTVENIGIKTTRLRSLSGELLVFANADLVSSRIRNYKQMRERRILFSLGVVYATPYEKLSMIPTLIREIIEAQEHVRFDRAHFASYGDFALNFEIVYYVLSADYNQYMDLQQTINLAIFKAFDEAGIEFAFPTQTLHLLGHPTT